MTRAGTLPATARLGHGPVARHAHTLMPRAPKKCGHIDPRPMTSLDAAPPLGLRCRARCSGYACCASAWSCRMSLPRSPGTDGDAQCGGVAHRGSRTEMPGAAASPSCSLLYVRKDSQLRGNRSRGRALRPSSTGGLMMWTEVSARRRARASIGGIVISLVNRARRSATTLANLRPSVGPGSDGDTLPVRQRGARPFPVDLVDLSDHRPHQLVHISETTELGIGICDPGFPSIPERLDLRREPRRVVEDGLPYPA
jgi:hypothetical protein